jgi:hypothetical protein
MTDAEDHKTIVELGLFQTNCRKYVADAVSIAEKMIYNSK